jgi:hypothetical protein
MKPSDYHIDPSNKVLHFILCAGLPRGLRHRKGKHSRSEVIDHEGAKAITFSITTNQYLLCPWIVRMKTFKVEKATQLQKLVASHNNESTAFY